MSLTLSRTLFIPILLSLSLSLTLCVRVCVCVFIYNIPSRTTYRSLLLILLLILFIYIDFLSLWIVSWRRVSVSCAHTPIDQCTQNVFWLFDFSSHYARMMIAYIALEYTYKLCIWFEQCMLNTYTCSFEIHSISVCHCFFLILSCWKLMPLKLLYDCCCCCDAYVAVAWIERYTNCV